MGPDHGPGEDSHVSRSRWRPAGLIQRRRSDSDPQLVLSRRPQSLTSVWLVILSHEAAERGARRPQTDRRRRLGVVFRQTQDARRRLITQRLWAPADGGDV